MVILLSSNPIENPSGDQNFQPSATHDEIQPLKENVNVKRIEMIETVKQDLVCFTTDEMAVMFLYGMHSMQL